MLDELGHECGVAALYWLSERAGKAGEASRSVHGGDVVPLMPEMLVDLENRGQLAAGLTSYSPGRVQLLDTYAEVGTVSEAFRMSHPEKHESILAEYAGRAAIGHTRYATSGANDRRYAQPFERHHGRPWKWFSFAFNGNLANYAELRGSLTAERGYHFTLNNDTEIIMHSLAYALRGDKPRPLERVLASLTRKFDGAYNIAFLDAMGQMVVSRDPLGLRPMNWAVQGRLFGAASESVALSNLGFTEITPLEPGQVAVVEDGRLRLERVASPRRLARCFFEWVYFSHVASIIDGSSVYLARARLGRRLAEMEDQRLDETCVVVPVPDTAKAASDAFAHDVGIPCVEGLIRNRSVGRTFIQPSSIRMPSAKRKYTPMPSVVKGKRAFLVEDSIVRGTTLKALARRMRQVGGAKEIHVRVACPPIIAPCFYGIDMSTLGELFAPRFASSRHAGDLSAETQAKMARELGVESLRYLPVADLAPCLDVAADSLCTACVTRSYPTLWGQKLLRTAKRHLASGRQARTYE